MNSIGNSDQRFKRRHRLHELMVALINQQKDLELIDAESSLVNSRSSSDQTVDPARWIDRNRRVLNHYHALVRTAITIDALLDAEDLETS